MATVGMRNGVDISYGRPAAARWRRRGLLLLALGLLAALVWFWRPLNLWAMTNSSYAARIACSCRYIGGRELSDCRKDLLPGMGLVMLGEDEDADGAGKSVTARLVPLASQTAFYREGQGCVLERFDR